MDCHQLAKHVSIYIVWDACHSITASLVEKGDLNDKQFSPETLFLGTHHPFPIPPTQVILESKDRSLCCL